MTEFYDRIENRLFNVRHCRNIEGVFRDLPLYEPPIDPLLLIRARAAGLDIDSVIAGLYAPLPHYRFSFTLQKALELCAELKALGGALLSALEKKDAEELTLLRSSHEIAMFDLVLETRKQQNAEAEANITALQQSEATILERFGQYQKLLGKTGITKGQDGLPVVEQSSSLAVSTDAGGEVSGLGLIPKEIAQLNWSEAANSYTQAANSVHLLTSILAVFPEIWVGAITTGQTFGGANLASAASAAAKAIEMGTVNAYYYANRMGTFAGYERRQDEWVHQSKLALAEMNQIQKQILAAQIRKSIADGELSHHETQIENARQVDDFMRDKFTNQQLYRWMSSQIAQVYFRTYQLALDQARRAERTFRFELGLDDKATPFVQAGQWHSLEKGLLAGEKLGHDLKRMEAAYLDQNKREYEITKHVSLLALDPLALITLRETGNCSVTIAEGWFDLDYPGHYLRRLKSVSISIPCVTGPYTGVSCTLTLEKNSVRHATAVEPRGYSRVDTVDDKDPRFTDNLGAIQSIVTSSAQNDSGLFETSLRDERYLPFEGAGAADSKWELEMPSEIRQFDYGSISDVILHIRYTSRDGGEDLKKAAADHVSAQISKATAAGMVRLFSVRHEFPDAWAKFKSVKIAGNVKTAELSLELRQEHYPFWSRGKGAHPGNEPTFLNVVTQAKLVARVREKGPTTLTLNPEADGSGQDVTLTDVKLTDDAKAIGLLSIILGPLGPAKPVTDKNAPLRLYFKNEPGPIEDLWLAITWRG